MSVWGMRGLGSMFVCFFLFFFWGESEREREREREIEEGGKVGVGWELDPERREGSGTVVNEMMADVGFLAGSDRLRDWSRRLSRARRRRCRHCAKCRSGENHVIDIGSKGFYFVRDFFKRH